MNNNAKTKSTQVVDNKEIQRTAKIRSSHSFKSGLKPAIEAVQRYLSSQRRKMTKNEVSCVKNFLTPLGRFD